VYRVGLTGGIGSGKTTVADLFSRHNITIIDTDVISHQITQQDGPAYQAIINTFGDEIVQNDGSIDRKKLATIVFSSAEKKKQLEDLLHPLIWIIAEQQAQASQSPYCIIVVPLLFEGKHQSRFNTTLAINCTEQQQIDRVKQRDEREIETIKAIIAQQMPANKKIELADNVINNNGDIKLLESEVEKLHNQYLTESVKFTSS